MPEAPQNGMPVPSLSVLAWQLLMKPITLRRRFEVWDWSLGGNPPLWLLYKPWVKGDSTHRRLARRLTTLLLVLMPVSAFLLSGAFWLLGVSVSWEAVALGAALGVAIGLTLGVTSGWVAGTVVGVTWGALGGVVEGAVFGATLGLALGLVSTTNGAGPLHDFERSLKKVLPYAALVGGAGGVAAAFLWAVLVPGSEARWVESLQVGGTFALLYAIALLQAPSYLAGCLVMTMALLTARSGIGLTRRLAACLPFQAYDLIYFRLPFVYSFIMRVSLMDQAMAKSMVDGFVRLPRQRERVMRALHKLQGRELEQIAKRRDYKQVAALDLVFISPEDEGFGYLFEPFNKASCRVVEAQERYKTSLTKLEALNEAEYILLDLQRKLAGPRSWQAGCVFDAMGFWIDALEEEKASVPKPMPNPFVAGPVLRPEKAALFRGRSDLIGLIRDVVENRGETILLFGQRRMGKSSLVRMLPFKIGKDIRIVDVNFQRLSVEDVPFRVVAEAVADAWTMSSPPPDSTDWRQTFSWLQEVDESLKEKGMHILVAVDELESLDKKFGEGRNTTDFLDMVRAAGDDLVRIRFLLTTAKSLRNLGPQWTDRLINVHPRELGPLKPEEARDLIRNPGPGFPDIYPSEGVEHIVEVTHGHPYLVQLVCDYLCRHLRDTDKLVATFADLEKAIDESLSKAINVFLEVWRTMGEEEQRVLLAVAGGKDLDESDREIVQTLKREKYISMKDDRWAVTVPMFERWIVEEML